MMLRSRDGALFEVRPVAYQFGPNPLAEPGTDWDANWLIIEGHAKARDGIEWSFTDPSLTTWEARSLARWLREVIDGTARFSPGWSDHAAIKHFTEPNIAFSLQGRSDTEARIRVHLSLEALPPHLHCSRRPDIFAHFIVIEMDLHALAIAADEWEVDCQAFPER